MTIETLRKVSQEILNPYVYSGVRGFAFKLMEKEIIIRDTRNGDWFWANKLVLDHPYFKASTKLVYLALAYFANNETQKAFPSIKTIMKMAGLGSRTTIINSIKQLEKYHFIEAKREKGKVSEYVLLKITDSRLVQKVNQSIKRRYQSTRRTGVVHLKHTNNTNRTRLNNKGLNKFKTSKKVLEEKMKV